MNLQEKIIKEVANTLQTDHEVTDKVCRSVFEFLAETMREEQFQQYRIQGLGLFEVKDYTRKKYEAGKIKKEEKERRNRELYNSIGSSSTTESHGCEDGTVDTTEQEKTIL